MCWILGRGGLLGSGLRKVLEREGTTEFIPEKRFPWHDTEACIRNVRDAAKKFALLTTGKSWYIIWAAGTGTMASTAEDLERETTVLTSLLNEIASFPDMSKGSLIYASSAGAVYAGCRDDVITENSVPVPLNPYGEAKLREEGVLQEFHRNHPACTVLIARITNLFGAAQSTMKRQGLISHIARSILRRETVNIFVPLDTIRDYITAESAADTMLRSIRTLEQGTMLIKIVASEEPTTIAKIIGTFTSITKIPPRIVTSASKLSASYPHRMCFKSIVRPAKQKEQPLLIGISDVLRAERLSLQKG